MRRLWRWLLYTLRLRPTYWRVRDGGMGWCTCGCGSFAPVVRVLVLGRAWATAEDMRVARAEALSAAVGPRKGRGRVHYVRDTGGGLTP